MTKNVWYGLTALVVVIGVVVSVWYVQKNAPATTSSNDAISKTTFETTPTPTTQITTTQGGTMQSEDITMGTGQEAVAGKTVTVNYVGTLTDGTKFDASADHGGTFSFKLGAGNVIEGWDKGVVGMKVGGKRKLTIPPDMGYGNQAVGSIPANSTLIFEIDLLKVE